MDREIENKQEPLKIPSRSEWNKEVNAPFTFPISIQSVVSAAVSKPLESIEENGKHKREFRFSSERKGKKGGGRRRNRLDFRVEAALTAGLTGYVRKLRSGMVREGGQGKRKVAAATELSSYFQRSPTGSFPFPAGRERSV